MTPNGPKYVPALLSREGLAALEARLPVAADTDCDSPITDYLARMHASLAADVRWVLSQSSRGKGHACPNSWDSDTILLNVRKIFDASEACADSGVTITGIRSLGEIAAVDAVMDRYDVGTHSAQWVFMVLNSVRRCYRVMFGETPGFLTTRLSYWAKLPRRRKRSPHGIEDFLSSAEAVASIADIFAEAGQTVRARALLCDADLLAEAAEMNARRGEYSRMEMDRCVAKTEAGKPIIEDFVRASDRKNREPRIALVSDKRALHLMALVNANRKAGPRFRRHGGRGMTPKDIYESIGRTTLMALGRRACINDLRDAGTKLTIDPNRMGPRIGSSNSVAVKVYRGSMAHEGLLLTREVLGLGEANTITEEG